ncbi:nucleotide exchange factor GrpE [Actinomadura flavalba]|uniref:nucleotide exchange factor GrpE n=1 Tax=Actinomadura flavalba TaxID=1120938 RepID=UPI00037B8C0B|nr:nucleotide exchange factor GrpE [Actinomadura flavalba]
MSSEPEPPVSADPGDAPVPGTASAQVVAALAALGARLDREHERAAHREAVIDRLHEENQRLRRGELESALAPLRAALYRLHDHARREARRFAEPDPPDAGYAAPLLAALADDVADALARSGVERFTVAAGAPYDVTRHRPVAVETVTDPELAETVRGVLSDGFEQNGRIVRKAEVRVGKLPAPVADRGTDR